MSKLTVEEIKEQSRGLRGSIEETLASEVSHFTEEDYQLLKFHGTYQQDDRDLRIERKRAGLDKAWSFMVRSKIPGGDLTAAQYLMHDKMADDLGNATMRITTREGFQLHGILKGGLRDCIARVKAAGLTTFGACGDVVRNTMGPSSPRATAAHRDALAISEELTQVFLPHSSSYFDLWINGEKVENPEPEPEPIYGQHYLPRKFKIGLAVPPRNDVDIYTQDIGLYPHLVEGEVEGYSMVVGGGFGMSHGKTETFPRLADPLFYVKREDVIAACVAVVEVQRDFGDRTDRKHARLKYTIADRGIDWFRDEVRKRLDAQTSPVKEVTWENVADDLGWHEQGDGKSFHGVFVPQGRVHDTETGQFRTAFRRIAQELHLPSRLTSNTNILFYNIAEEQKAVFEQILDDCAIPRAEAMTAARQTGHACVALPTCGLALAESERVFSALMDQVDPVLREFGLENDPLLIRMTGCPNGCARPYNADIAFVGRAPGKYAMYVGGSSRGTRLAGLYKKTVKFEEAPGEIRRLLSDFAANRQAGERFTDYWGRTQVNGDAPHPEQFHEELAERAALR